MRADPSTSHVMRTALATARRAAARRARSTVPRALAGGLTATLLAVAAPASAQRAPNAQTAAVPVAARSADGLRPGAHEAVLNGVRLWWRVAGAAAPGVPPVVYLHGGPGYNSASFAALAGPALERGLRMVYLDQRGSGRSERPWTGHYALDTLVADVEALRAALGVPRVALVGHSFGGTLALEYAARHPERVAALVLVSAASDIPAACAARVDWLTTHHADAVARARADTAGRGGAPRTACDLAFQSLSGAAHQRYNDAVMFPDSAVRVRQDSVDAASGLRNTGELGGALWNAGLLQYRFDRHARLAMPALVVAGAHDWAIGLAPQRALAERLPRARLVVFERSGHMPYLDETERFAREVTAFVRGATRP